MEPTCECGHSRYDHEQGDFADPPGRCHGAFDCECAFYMGPDLDEPGVEPDNPGENLPADVTPGSVITLWRRAEVYRERVR